MLFPLFPLKPQRLARVSSFPLIAFRGRPCWGEKARFLSLFLGDRPKSRPLGGAPPPRIAETDDWAHRVCFLIAEVTVIHSVVIRATGSMAIEIEASEAGV